MNLLELGTCNKLHGIKGGLVFFLFNTQDSCLKEGVTITLRPKAGSNLKEQTEFKIKSLAFGNKVICYLKGVDDRTKAEELVPFEILIDDTYLPETESGEFYIKDFIGCEVFDESSKEILGKIKEFYENGVQVVFTITDGKEEFDVPYVDTFFKEINIEEKKVFIIKPQFID